MRYDAVLYDFDGTLVDSIPLIVNCFHIAFEEVLGFRKEEKEVLSTIGLPLWTAFEEYDKEIQGRLHEAYLRANERLLPTGVRMFPGIHEGLRAVQDLRIPQGVVTSKRREPAVFTMKQFDMERYFDLLISREDTTEHKPAPAPLYLAAEKLGISDMSRILFVGDSIHDLMCANNAGADSAAVAWTYMPVDKLKSLSPKYWLQDLSEISCILSEREL